MYYAQRIPVLMYHRVGEPDHARDVYRICPDGFAAPVLKTLGWPATVFLVAGKLGRKSDRELKFCVSHNVYPEMMLIGMKVGSFWQPCRTCFRDRLRAWSMGPELRELALNALLMAEGRRRPERQELVHSDQGSQFSSHD